MLLDDCPIFLRDLKLFLAKFFKNKDDDDVFNKKLIAIIIIFLYLLIK